MFVEPPIDDFLQYLIDMGFLEETYMVVVVVEDNFVEEALVHILHLWESSAVVVVLTRLMVAFPYPVMRPMLVPLEPLSHLIVVLDHLEGVYFVMLLPLGQRHSPVVVGFPVVLA